MIHHLDTDVKSNRQPTEHRMDNGAGMNQVTKGKNLIRDGAIRDGTTHVLPASLLAERKTEYRASVPLWRWGVVELYSAILCQDVGPKLTPESVAFAYGLGLYLDDLLHAPQQQYMVSDKHMVEWSQTFGLYGPTTLKRIRATLTRLGLEKSYLISDSKPR
jgi:hypothetical protein